MLECEQCQIRSWPGLVYQPPDARPMHQAPAPLHTASRSSCEWRFTTATAFSKLYMTASCSVAAAIPNTRVATRLKRSDYTGRKAGTLRCLNRRAFELLNNETSRIWARYAVIEARDCGNVQMQCYPRPIRLGWSQLEAGSNILKSLLHTDTRTYRAILWGAS